MTLKRFTTLLFFISSIASVAQELIDVSGKVLNFKDSSAVVAKIYYEKLPYYDDMGMTGSQLDGSYQLKLIKDTKYNFRVENLNGFQPYLQEITVTASESDEKYIFDLYIVPDEREELIRLENLNFSRGSATISEDSYAGLDKFVTYINTKPDVIIQLEGHTDFAGNADANLRLSQARVESVAEYIIGKGVKKGRVVTKAFGGTKPLTSERTDEAKALNRRVEVRLIRQD